MPLNAKIGLKRYSAAGTIYEDKTENCNNFLHWAPFSLMNDEADATNLFYKDNDDLRPKACTGHCLDKAPLFAQLGQWASLSFQCLFRRRFRRRIPGLDSLLEKLCECKI